MCSSFSADVRLRKILEDTKTTFRLGVPLTRECLFCWTTDNVYGSTLLQEFTSRIRHLWPSASVWYTFFPILKSASPVVACGLAQPLCLWGQFTSAIFGLRPQIGVSLFFLHTQPIYKNTKSTKLVLMDVSIYLKRETVFTRNYIIITIRDRVNR